MARKNAFGIANLVLSGRPGVQKLHIVVILQHFSPHLFATSSYRSHYFPRHVLRQLFSLLITSVSRDQLFLH